jgi:hypothetical protein
MTDRKQTLIIDTGERIGAGEDRAEQTNLNFISSDGIDTAENPLIDFNVKLSQPLTISKTCNIFIDHITLSGARPSLMPESPGLLTETVLSGVDPSTTFKFSAAGENITLSQGYHPFIDLGAATPTPSEDLSTLSPTEGPMLQLKIIGIGTSTSMEHNPYVNATDPSKLDLQKTFQFSNTNIYTGNVHTYTDTTFNYVSTIKATSQHPVKIKSIRFKLQYKWPGYLDFLSAGHPVFNVKNENKNRAIIEFLFDPI